MTRSGPLTGNTYVVEDIDSVVMRHALEDADARELRSKAEPLVVQLKTGINYFEPADFFALVRFFQESIADLGEAMETGALDLFGQFRLVRVPVGALVTIEELAAMAGVHRTTALRWAHTSNVPFCFRGKKKLYNIHGLQIQVCNVGEAGGTGLR